MFVLAIDKAFSLFFSLRKMYLTNNTNGVDFKRSKLVSKIFDFIFEILSLKEQQLFKGFAFFGTLGINNYLVYSEKKSHSTKTILVLINKSTNVKLCYYKTYLRPVLKSSFVT
ncbi:hypothetical protein BpHYR1_006199, partial [Brachionus plicatilis]